jgi:hypothetical protein
MRMMRKMMILEPRGDQQGVRVILNPFLVSSIADLTIMTKENFEVK